MGMSGVCLEITPPERLVATEKFDQPWYSGGATGAITLAEECGPTTLTQTVRYDSQAARDMVLQRAIEHGVALGYDRLRSEEFVDWCLFRRMVTASLKRIFTSQPRKAPSCLNPGSFEKREQ